MPNGPSRLLVAVLFLAVGIAGGYLLHRPQTVPGTNPTLHVVTVGKSAADVDPTTITLAKPDPTAPGHLVFWASTTKNRHLRIEFDQEIFEKMTKSGSRFAVNCKGRQCTSGDLLDSLPPMPADGYKYSQILTDPDGSKADEKDGHVIIDK